MCCISWACKSHLGTCFKSCELPCYTCDDDELHVALGVIPSVPLWSCEQPWFLKGVCVTAV